MTNVLPDYDDLAQIIIDCQNLIRNGFGTNDAVVLTICLSEETSRWDWAISAYPAEVINIQNEDSEEYDSVFGFVIEADDSPSTNPYELADNILSEIEYFLTERALEDAEWERQTQEESSASPLRLVDPYEEYPEDEDDEWYDDSDIERARYAEHVEEHVDLKLF